MQEIFTLEFHPVDGTPRRVRFCVSDGSDNIERITERQREGRWTRVDSEVVEYFEYSDA